MERVRTDSLHLFLAFAIPSPAILPYPRFPEEKATTNTAIKGKGLQISWPQSAKTEGTNEGEVTIRKQTERQNIKNTIPLE